MVRQQHNANLVHLGVHVRPAVELRTYVVQQGVQYENAAAAVALIGQGIPVSGNANRRQGHRVQVSQNGSHR